MTNEQCVEVLRDGKYKTKLFWDAVLQALTILENLNDENLIDIIEYQESCYDAIHLTLKPRQSKREFVAQAILKGIAQ